MTTLDDNQDFIDPADVPMWNTAIRYGLIGGGITVAYSLINNLLGMNQVSMTNAAIAIVVSTLIFIFIVRAAIKTHRDNELGGYIKLGRAFALGTVACIIMGIIGGLFNYLYFNFIDPAAVERMAEQVGEMMDGFGLPEEAIEQAIEDSRNGFTFGKSMLNSVLGGGVIGAIVSVITGSIMKKEAPIEG